MVAGSVGHQMHLCGCYGGDKDDPPGLGRRDAARAALAYFTNGPLGVSHLGWKRDATIN